MRGRINLINIWVEWRRYSIICLVNRNWGSREWRRGVRLWGGKRKIRKIRIVRNALLLLISRTIPGIMSVVLLSKEINLGKIVEIIGIRPESSILLPWGNSWRKSRSRSALSILICLLTQSPRSCWERKSLLSTEREKEERRGLIMRSSLHEKSQSTVKVFSRVIRLKMGVNWQDLIR